MPEYIYGIFEGDGGPLVPQESVVDPRGAREHVGHRLTVSIYGDQNMAIECEDCNIIIWDIDYEVEHNGGHPEGRA